MTRWASVNASAMMGYRSRTGRSICGSGVLPRRGWPGGRGASGAGRPPEPTITAGRATTTPSAEGCAE